jgi:hypothetical protein
MDIVPVWVGVGPPDVVLGVVWFEVWLLLVDVGEVGVDVVGRGRPLLISIQYELPTLITLQSAFTLGF